MKYFFDKKKRTKYLCYVCLRINAFNFMASILFISVSESLLWWPNHYTILYTFLLFASLIRFFIPISTICCLFNFYSVCLSYLYGSFMSHSKYMQCHRRKKKHWFSLKCNLWHDLIFRFLFLSWFLWAFHGQI